MLLHLEAQYANWIIIMDADEDTGRISHVILKSDHNDDGLYLAAHEITWLKTMNGRAILTEIIDSHPKLDIETNYGVRAIEVIRRMINTIEVSNV